MDLFLLFAFCFFIDKFVKNNDNDKRTNDKWQRTSWKQPWLAKINGSNKNISIKHSALCFQRFVFNWNVKFKLYFEWLKLLYVITNKKVYFHQKFSIVFTRICLIAMVQIVLWTIVAAWCDHFVLWKLLNVITSYNCSCSMWLIVLWKLLNVIILDKLKLFNVIILKNKSCLMWSLWTIKAS